MLALGSRFAAAMAAADAARSGGLRPPAGFTYDREPDPAWVAMLDTLTPRTEVLSWLYIAWEPGDAWEPVQRWVVWTMRPAAAISPDILAELQGPSPRATGHFCAAGNCPCDLKANAWVGGTPVAFIDRMTWELYRRTGCYGTRYWVVQGDRGGHRYRYSQAESQLSRSRGGPESPPSAGDLPYAEPDARTWAALAERDRLRRYAMLTDFLQRRPSVFDAEERDQARAAADALWHSLSEQLGAVVSDVAPQLRDSLRDMPRSPGAREELRAMGDLDDAHAEFIETVSGVAAD